MAYSLIASTSKNDTTNGGTTSGIDTTGADLLVVGVSHYGGTCTVSDSKGNTWTGATKYATGSETVQLFYVANATVGSGHTFTIGGGTLYQCIMVTAWSGGKLTSPLDGESGLGGNSNSRAPGSVTPAEDNELLITLLCLDASPGGTVSVDSGFTKLFSLDQGTAIGGYLGYLIQTTAAAKNPTWSWTTTRNNSANLATFKVAAAATANPKNVFGGIMLQGPLRRNVLP